MGFDSPSRGGEVRDDPRDRRRPIDAPYPDPIDNPFWGDPATAMIPPTPVTWAWANAPDPNDPGGAIDWEAPLEPPLPGSSAPAEARTPIAVPPPVGHVRDSSLAYDPLTHGDVSLGLNDSVNSAPSRPARSVRLQVGDVVVVDGQRYQAVPSPHRPPAWAEATALPRMAPDAGCFPVGVGTTVVEELQGGTRHFGGYQTPGHSLVDDGLVDGWDGGRHRALADELSTQPGHRLEALGHYHHAVALGGHDAALAHLRLADMAQGGLALDPADLRARSGDLPQVDRRRHLIAAAEHPAVRDQAATEMLRAAAGNGWQHEDARAVDAMANVVGGDWAAGFRARAAAAAADVSLTHAIGWLPDGLASPVAATRDQAVAAAGRVVAAAHAAGSAPGLSAIEAHVGDSPTLDPGQRAGLTDRIDSARQRMSEAELDGALEAVRAQLGEADVAHGFDTQVRRVAEAGGRRRDAMVVAAVRRAADNRMAAELAGEAQAAPVAAHVDRVVARAIEAADASGDVRSAVRYGVAHAAAAGPAAAVRDAAHTHALRRGLTAADPRVRERSASVLETGIRTSPDVPRNLLFAENWRRLGTPEAERVGAAAAEVGHRAFAEMFTPPTEAPPRPAPVPTALQGLPISGLRSGFTVTANLGPVARPTLSAPPVDMLPEAASATGIGSVHAEQQAWMASPDGRAVFAAQRAWLDSPDAQAAIAAQRAWMDSPAGRAQIGELRDRVYSRQHSGMRAPGPQYRDANQPPPWLAGAPRDDSPLGAQQPGRDADGGRQGGLRGRLTALRGQQASRRDRPGPDRGL